MQTFHPLQNETKQAYWERKKIDGHKVPKSVFPRTNEWITHTSLRKKNLYLIKSKSEFIISISLSLKNLFTPYEVFSPTSIWPTDYWPNGYTVFLLSSFIGFSTLRTRAAGDEKPSQEVWVEDERLRAFATRRLQLYTVPLASVVLHPIAKQCMVDFLNIKARRSYLN